MRGNISSEIAEFIQERSQIWDKYDKTMVEANELKKLEEFNRPTIAKKLSPLTKDNSPPEELSEAIWKIKQESDKIKKCQSNIQGYQSEIERIKGQFYTIVIAVIVLVFILFAIIAAF